MNRTASSFPKMPDLSVQYLFTQARNALKDTAEQQVKFNEALARAKAEIEAKAKAQNNGDHSGSNGNGTSDEEHTRSVKPSGLKNAALKKPGNVIVRQKFDLLYCRSPKTEPKSFHSLCGMARLNYENAMNRRRIIL